METVVVEVFRFGEDVSVPVAKFGSVLRVAPLTGRDAQGTVQVAYLPVGGRVGRHPASSDTLFAVVAGSGWVSGGEGQRRPVWAGYGVRWEVGEDHEVLRSG